MMPLSTSEQQSQACPLPWAGPVYEMKAVGLSGTRAVRRGWRLSGILVKVVVRKKKVWAHQKGTPGDERRP